MIRLAAASVRSPIRSGRITASLFAALLLTMACSEGGITVPPTAATQAAAVSTVSGQQKSAEDNAGINVGPLTNGGNHSGSVTAAGQTDSWTFSATQGQLLVVAIGELTGVADFTPWIRLRDPNGAIIATTSNVAAAQIVIAAPLTGTYTVLAATQDPGLDATGTYQLMAAQLPGNFIVSAGDQGGALTNGANHAGSLTVGDIDLWSISANQGDAIIVAIGEVTGSADFMPWIRVISPSGAIVTSAAGALAAQSQLTAPATGTYTVIVSTSDAGNDGTGDYSLTIAKGPGAITISSGDQGGPLTDGLTHTGSIPVGDLDAWTFSAAAGDYIVLAMGEGTASPNFTPWMRLIAPNGNVIANASNSAAIQFAVNAPVAGSYTVVLSTNDAGTDDTGDYTLTLSTGSGVPSVSPGDQGGPMTNGANHTGTIALGDIDSYTFSANQGDGIILALGELSGAVDFTPWIRLVAPNGSVVTSAANVTAAQAIATASLTGTYRVIISTNDAGNDATGDYTLTMAKNPGTITTSPGDQGGPATNGGNNTGSIIPGDLDVFTFNTNQGLPFAVSIGELSGSANFTPWIRVIGPNGNFIGNSSNVAAAQFSTIAPLSGQYMVVISTNDAGNDDTGTYQLIVQKSGAFVTPPGDEGGTMTNGAIHTGAITIGDLDRWTFAASQGETIAISAGEVSGTDFSPWIRLVSPGGLVVGNSSSTAVAQVNVTAQETGTYTIAVGTNDAGFDGTGNYTLTLAKAPGSFIVSPGDQGGAISNGAVGGIIAVGDLDMWSVTANQGSPLMLTMSEVSGTADFTPWMRLVAPNGLVIANSSGPTGANVNVSAPSTGTYTIILGTLDAGFDATGQYQLTVAGVNLAPRPTMVPVVGKLDAFLSPRPTSYGPEGVR